MIGAESIISACPSAPTKTGQVPTLRHAAAAARSRSGGSTSETNAPCRTLRIAWVEARERSIAASRSPRSTPSKACGYRRGASRGTTPPRARALRPQRYPRRSVARGPGPRRRLRPHRATAPAPPARERESSAMRTGRQRRRATRRRARPRVPPPPAKRDRTWSLDPQDRHGVERRFRVDGPLRERGDEFPDPAVRQVQEPDAGLEGRRRSSPDQAFRLVAVVEPSPRSATVVLRVKPAERPALVVLDRRPVRIEDVALVQHGVGDAVHIGTVHGVTGSSAEASSRSSACSQVGWPPRLR